MALSEVLTRNDVRTFSASLGKNFWQFLESVPDAMILSDRTGRIVLSNTNTERMFGYSSQELVGKKIEILVPERLRALHRKHRAIYDAWPRTRRMGVGRDLCALGKDGVEFPVEISLSTVEIQGKTFVWTAIRSIGDRERTVSQLLVELEKRGIILGGLIGICAWCKRIQDQGGLWQEWERYIESHSQAKFSHGICPDCLGKLEPALHKPYLKEAVNSGKNNPNKRYMVEE
jgi:PAS domain S-box-containing protein